MKRAILTIVGLGLLVFGLSLRNGFVGDDVSQIAQNSSLQKLENISLFFTGSTFYNGGGKMLAGVYYKPLLQTYFAVIVTVLGSNATAFHFAQIVLAITVAIVIFLFFREFFSHELAFFLALIFLVHPINSEAVFYISAAQEPLFLVFGILGLWLFIRNSSVISQTVAMICLTLALFSKETGILFFVVACVYAVLFARKKWLSLALFSALILPMYGTLRVLAVGFSIHSPSAPIGQLPFLLRLLNQPRLALIYFKVLFFPIWLSSSYNAVITALSWSQFFLPLIVDLVALCLGVLPLFYFFKTKQKKLFQQYGFFVIWFVIGLAFHLQFFALDVAAAERWFYFPMVGFLGMVGVVVSTQISKKNQRILAVCAVLLVLLLSLRTVVRGFDWKNEWTLDSKDITVTPDSYDLENGMSGYLLSQNKFAQAKQHALRSVAMFPYLTNEMNLGLAHVGLGEYPQAKVAYEKALTFGPYYQVYENMGGLALVYGNPSENISFLKKSVELFPQDAELWRDLAIVEYTNGQKDAALSAVTNALRLAPDDVNIGFVYNKIVKAEPLQLQFTVGKD